MTPERAFHPIRSLQSSWRLLSQAPLPLWVGGLLLVLLESIGGTGGRVSSQGGDELALGWGLLVLLMLLGVVLWLVVSLASAYLSVGYFNTVREVMRSGQAAFEDVLDARGRWGRLFFARIVQGLLGLCAALPMAVPPTVAMMLHAGLGLERELAILLGILGVLAYLPAFFYILLGLVFVEYEVALRGASIGDAISHSWQLARGKRLQLIVFILASILIAIVGMMLCCVGFLPALILINVMWCEAYVQATRDGHDPESWWVDGQRGPDSPSSVSSAWGEAPEAPLETRLPTPPTTPVVGEAEESPPPQPFDPGRWRDDADIPPIDDRD